MPRPCAVETHARGYQESCATLPDATGLPRGVSRLWLPKKVAQLSLMPRACPVEFHACGYQESCATLPDATGLPRWSFTLVATKESCATLPDATGLPRGDSRSRLQRKLRNSP